MPYLAAQRKKEVDATGQPISTGDLTYVIYRECLKYIERKQKEASYADLSEVKAALDNAKDEWYRREMAPYEDKKIEQNGDVLDHE